MGRLSRETDFRMGEKKREAAENCFIKGKGKSSRIATEKGGRGKRGSREACGKGGVETSLEKGDEHKSFDLALPPEERKRRKKTRERKKNPNPESQTKNIDHIIRKKKKRTGLILEKGIII